MRLVSGLLIAAMLACLALVAACGGGGDGDRLSEEEYFARVSLLTDPSDDLGDGLADEIGDPDDFESMDEWVVSYYVVTYGVLADGYRSIAAELDQVEPPENLASLHRAFLAAVEVVIDGLEETIANLEAVDPEELDETLFSLRGIDLISDVCDDLEDSALRSGVTLGGYCAGGISDGVSVGEVCVGSLADGEECDGDGGGTVDIAPGIRGELAEMPPLPDGLVAMTQYIEFEVTGDNLAGTIGLPLEDAVDDASGLGFFSYDDGEWLRLEVGVRLEQDGTVASGDFEAMPASLAVLREE